MRALIVLWLCCLGLTFTLASEHECGLLQRLKLKEQWSEVYGNGLGRLNFGKSVIDKFIVSNPKHRELLKSVNADTNSVRFYAYLARKFGAIDMFIGQLEAQATFQALLDHARDMYAPLNRSQTFYDDFVKSIISAAVKDIIARYDHFDLQSWQSCLGLLFSGLITQEEETIEEMSYEETVTIDDYFGTNDVHGIIDIIDIGDTRGSVTTANGDDAERKHDNIHNDNDDVEHTTEGYDGNVINDDGGVEHDENVINDDDNVEHTSDGYDKNVINDDGDVEHDENVINDDDNVEHTSDGYDENVINDDGDVERTTDGYHEHVTNYDGYIEHVINDDDDVEHTTESDAANISQNNSEHASHEDDDVENTTDGYNDNAVHVEAAGNATSIYHPDNDDVQDKDDDDDKEVHITEGHQDVNKDNGDDVATFTTSTYNDDDVHTNDSSGVGTAEKVVAETLPTVQLATDVTVAPEVEAELESPAIEQDDVEPIGLPKELNLEKIILENEANKDIAQLEILFSETKQ